LRQVLNRDRFAQVTPGLDKSQVRRLLGKPARTQAYPLKNQEAWDWRFSDGQEPKVFSVSFDADGRVVSIATTIDMREQSP
jgi:outer membrane protein assembly factor BamE (lipoprotein component of BamABCDE complex)